AEETDSKPALLTAATLPFTAPPAPAFFHQADSFAIMRGGHLDVCVLGAFQVSATGDLANWHTGAPDAIPAVGGAMDLAIGAKQDYVMMSRFTRDGDIKLVPQATYPLTGVGCVSRLYTDHGIFDLSDTGTVSVRALFGITMEELKVNSEIEFVDAT